MADVSEGADRWFEARTAETLQRIGRALVSELDLNKVVQLVTDAATELIGAQFGAFFYNVADDAGESYLLYALSGAPPEAFADFPMPRNTAIFDPTFRGEGVIRLGDVTADPRYGQNAPYYGMPPGHLPVRSYLAVPVMSRHGEVLGGLFFGHGQPDVFTLQHEHLVVNVAAHAAIAIDNARLFQAAQREREAAERLADRLTHLQAVSARLAGAMDVEDVGDVIVGAAEPALGFDRAALYVLEPDGNTLRLVRSVGMDQSSVDRWRRLSRNDAAPVSQALRTQAPILVDDREQWPDRYPEVSRAVAVLPLALADQVFGVAAFAWDECRPFDQEDRQFLDALADQAAQALERLRLYEQERESARTLQRSLLPPRTPEIPGMDVAALYRAGDRSVAVGGDFYDIFRLGPNRWGLAMGDVCGRGARAASRTALVRYTLRAVAGMVDAPIDTLNRVNGALLAEPAADDRFCAALFAHVEIDRCGAWVTMACAGHPRPVVVRRAGWIDVRGQPGTLLGVLERLDVSEDRVGLGPGDALVFFTDGISEARNGAGDQFAEEALQSVLLHSIGTTAEELVERVQRAALEYSGGSLGDDAALLVVRVPPEAATDPDGRLRSALGEEAVAPNYPLPDGGHSERLQPPREARMQLPPHPTSARRARQFLSGVVNSWRMPELDRGDAELLLSEVATNAILHARSDFTVIVRYDGRNLRVEVGDGSRAEPRPPITEAPDAPGGRGLVVLEQLAARWGMLRTARGKRVWFEIPGP
jgi:GAF domain-containing protein/anti-sigma regulatory factor (Ser/Thr protein kinase)